MESGRPPASAFYLSKFGRFLPKSMCVWFVSLYLLVGCGTGGSVFRVARHHVAKENTRSILPLDGRDDMTIFALVGLF